MHIPEAQSDPVPQGFPYLPEPVDIITFIDARGDAPVVGGVPAVGGAPGIGAPPGIGAAPDIGGVGGIGAVF
jgi:hypothetical protein